MQNSVYPFEYMNNWEKFNEISLPEKEDSYGHLIWKTLLIKIAHKQKEFVKVLK